LENLKGRDHSEDLGSDGKITLEWFSGHRMERCKLDAFCSGWGPGGGSCEHGNEPSGSVKGGELLDCLIDC
jgi:hypothetical protein